MRALLFRCTRWLCPGPELTARPHLPLDSHLSHSSSSLSPLDPLPAASGRLLLFYCESRKSLSPGGDIKYITSPDLGDSWLPPVTIYTHEAEEEVPKVCSGRLLVAQDGAWYLPVHREPAESWHTFTGKGFHPLSEAPEQQLQMAAPAGATPQARHAAPRPPCMPSLVRSLAAAEPPCCLQGPARCSPARRMSLAGACQAGAQPLSPGSHAAIALLPCRA